MNTVPKVSTVTDWWTEWGLSACDLCSPFKVVSFLPLPSCKACVKEMLTMLLGSSCLRSPQARQLCPAGSMQLAFYYFFQYLGFLCCFFLNGCHLSVKVMHQSPSQTCLSLQVGFCGCCIPRCSAKDGERCRHTASARTVAFSVLPVAASQCEDHHCCSWENWWRQELQIPQPWSLVHSCALPRGEGDCCQRIQVPSWASWSGFISEAS